jgi:hypothetical protein
MPMITSVQVEELDGSTSDFEMTGGCGRVVLAQLICRVMAKRGGRSPSEVRVNPSDYFYAEQDFPGRQRPLRVLDTPLVSDPACAVGVPVVSMRDLHASS